MYIFYLFLLLLKKYLRRTINYYKYIKSHPAEEFISIVKFILRKNELKIHIINYFLHMGYISKNKLKK